MPKKVKMTADSETIELSEQEFEALIQALDDFEEIALQHLCDSDNYQIIPNEDDEGNLLTREQMRLAARQVRSMGYEVLYKIDKGNEILYYEPKTGRILIESEGIH